MASPQFDSGPQLNSGIVRYDETDQPGTYRLQDADDKAAASEVFAVSVSAAESDSRSNNEKVIDKLVEDDRVDHHGLDGELDLASLVGAIPRTVSDQNPGRAIWPALLIGLLVALMVESFFAGYSAFRRYGRTRGVESRRQRKTDQRKDRFGFTTTTREILSPRFQSTCRRRRFMIDMLTLFADSDPAAVVTERIEVLGPIGWTGSVIVGSVLILASTFWLIRQRRLLGTKTVCGLSLLRAVVIGLLFGWSHNRHGAGPKRPRERQSCWCWPTRATA